MASMVLMQFPRRRFAILWCEIFAYSSHSDTSTFSSQGDEYRAESACAKEAGHMAL